MESNHLAISWAPGYVFHAVSEMMRTGFHSMTEYVRHRDIFVYGQRSSKYAQRYITYAPDEPGVYNNVAVFCLFHPSKGHDQ